MRGAYSLCSTPIGCGSAWLSHLHRDAVEVRSTMVVVLSSLSQAALMFQHADVAFACGGVVSLSDSNVTA